MVRSLSMSYWCTNQPFPRLFILDLIPLQVEPQEALSKGSTHVPRSAAVERSMDWKKREEIRAHLSFLAVKF